jgi:ADP-heptose:LPS heptosyltransferase
VNIVIFKVSALGDTVVFLPVVQALRRLHPDWRITVVTTCATTTLFRETLPAENVIGVDRDPLKRAWRRPWRLLAWWRRIRQCRPDAVLMSWDQSSVAHFLGASSGAKLRVGGADSVVRLRGGFSHTIKKNPTHSIAEWDWAMAGTMMAALGKWWPATPPLPIIPVRSASLAGGGKTRVVVHPGGSREYQRWMPERFAALAKSLAVDCDVAWIDLPEFSVTPPPDVRVVRSPILDELVQLLAEADLYVGNHSGAFHLAMALERPCVIPTGPTFPAYDPPWHAERVRLLRASSVACMPCDRLTQGANRCGNASAPMACLKYWTVEAVEGVCRDLLARFPRSVVAR